MKTYEDFVQELQRGTITLSEFVRYTEDEYEEWLLKENLKDNN